MIVICVHDWPAWFLLLFTMSDLVQISVKKKPVLCSQDFPGPNRVCITCISTTLASPGSAQISIKSCWSYDVHCKILTSVDFIHMYHCIMIKSPWFLVNHAPFATQSLWKVAPVSSVHQRACEGYLRTPRQRGSYLTKWLNTVTLVPLW